MTNAPARRVVLALPAYNEEISLPAVLQRFDRVAAGAGWNYAAVVVDDGSSDGTAGVLRNAPASLALKVVVHAQNRGLGETIVDALAEASRLAGNGGIVVTMDADNTHSPELIPELVRRIEKGNDIAIASRYRPGSRVIGLSRFRHSMSYGARFLFQSLLPMQGVRDYTCSFRAYRAELLERAFALYGPSLARERGFACMAEILVKLGALGARAAEIPMELRYDIKGGASKMNVGLTAANTLRLILRLRRSRCVPVQP